VKFELGDLIKFVWTDFKTQSGRIVIPIPSDNNRGNNVGIIVSSLYPPYDLRLYYTYKVHYQNGYTSWEVEDNLRHLENYLNKIKKLENNL